MFIAMLVAIYYGNSVITYTWSPALGLNFTNVSNPIATLKNSTTYNVEVKISIGCVATASVYVNVIPLTATTNNITLPCGNTANIGVRTNYTFEENLTYTWSPSTGLSNANIKNPEVSTNSNASYSLEVKTINGCSATSNVNINTSTIDFTPFICFVTVNVNDENVIVWQPFASSATKWLYIYKESSFQTDYYDLLGKIPYTSSGSFVDINSDARVQSNKYKIGVQDVCGYYT